jgi:5-methyltetrahydropteroyltriglutamate--homocysteine methyltransferase
MKKLFPCTIVGSYVQPEWLIDRKKLAGQFPPRTRMKELWRIDPEFLQAAQDDAVEMAVRDQERAGMDVVTDGEVRRESYSNHVANALEGVDLDQPGTALDRHGSTVPVPRIAGPINWKGPICVEDVKFLRSITDRQIKITVPGPFTASQQAQDDYYDKPRDAAMAYADAINAEMKALFEAGADVVSIDEPYMQARSDAARDYGVEAVNQALKGIKGKTCLHICFGYAEIIKDRPEGGYSFLPELENTDIDQISIETAQSNLDCKILESLPSKEILLGVLNLGTHEVETPNEIADRVRRALPHIDKERVILAPDCGFKYSPRSSAFGKLKAMSEAAEILRQELG